MDYDGDRIFYRPKGVGRVQKIGDQARPDTSYVEKDWQRAARIGARLRMQIRTIEYQENKIAQLTKEATRDVLTHLLNRRGFNEAFTNLEDTILRYLYGASDDQKTQKSTRGLALVFMDLDNFKNLNDTHGHAAGDEALVGFAKLLRREFKRPSDIISRFGGDEFVMLIEAEDRERVMKKLNRFRKCVAEEMGYQGITTTIGFTFTQDHKANFDVLKAQADVAMYAAKRIGERSRNQVAFDDGDGGIGILVRGDGNEVARTFTKEEVQSALRGGIPRAGAPIVAATFNL